MAQLQLEQQIRFALAQLGERNAHHEFEQLCLAFARRRISVNLLPATGPVSAGGDQGRDAESFWSSLPQELGEATRVGSAPVGSDRLVLACTMQTSSLTSKIRSDVASITASGTRVDRVFYFLTSPLPVAQRHKVVADVLEEHAVALEVVDVVALSTHLADPDLYWIASEFLRLPADAGPVEARPSELPDWYVRARARWVAPQQPPSTPGDLVELRMLARTATRVAEARPDLAPVLTLLDELARNADADIAWQAGYERCVATYRGSGDFRSVEQLLVKLIESAAVRPADATRLMDAVSLVSYGIGAALRGLAATSLSGWQALRVLLLSALEERLLAPTTPNEHAALLSVHVRLAFVVAIPDEVVPAGVLTKDELFSAGTMLPTAVPLADRDAGMRALRDLLADIPHAPMFPVAPIAELFDLLTVTLLDHPLYAVVREELEMVVAQAEGADAAGRRAGERAYRLADAEQWLAAVVEAQTASRSFWDAHDVGAAVRFMLVEGGALRMLGLHIAAKTRFLAAAYAAGSHSDDEVRTLSAEAMLEAAQQDYYLGRWATALQESLTGFVQHARLLPDPGDLEWHEHLEAAGQSWTNILAVAAKAPPLWSWLIGEVDPADELAVTLETAAVSDQDVQSVYEQVAAAGLQPPFADLQPSWRVAFRAFGVTFRFEFDRADLTVLAADRFICALQLLLLGLAGRPVEWLPTDVRVSVIVDAGAGSERFRSLPRPEEGGLAFEVRLTADADLADAPADHRMTRLFGEAHGIAAALIAAVSLQPDAELLELLVASERIPSFAAPAVRVYDDTARVLLPTWEMWPQPGLAAGLPLGDFEAVVTTELAAPEGWSPRLQVAEVEQRVAERYAAVGPMMAVSLPGILTDSAAMRGLRDAHEDGALDWQLLTALVSLVGTWRVEQAGLDPRLPANQDAIEALMRSAEQVDDRPLPPSAVTAEAFAMALEVTMATVLPSYGLRVLPGPVDWSAVRTVLVDRFGYAVIDQAHPDVFGWG